MTYTILHIFTYEITWGVEPISLGLSLRIANDKKGEGEEKMLKAFQRKERKVLVDNSVHYTTCISDLSRLSEKYSFVMCCKEMKIKIL